jgi:hypothetical protein
VITTRNVTFNKQLFYNKGDKSIAIPITKLSKVVKLLYKEDKIINIGEAIKLPIIEDLLLSLCTKQQLRGKV